MEIYGNGVENDNLNTIITDKKLNENVFLKGVADRNDIVTKYKNSHFLILPMALAKL